MGKQIKISLLINSIAVTLFILPLAFIYLQSSFLFQHCKKAMKAYIILHHMCLLLQETS